MQTDEVEVPKFLTALELIPDIMQFIQNEPAGTYFFEGGSVEWRRVPSGMGRDAIEGHVSSHGLYDEWLHLFHQPLSSVQDYITEAICKIAAQVDKP